jgi:peptide/nickel transport system ATP-binding protein
MIFQEPMNSFGPLHTIGDQITEAMLIHNRKMKMPEARERAIELLQQVGIPQPAKRIDDYPHQFSGGMRQRAMIAMALSCSPQLLLADEPTTALDVTIQAQILDLIRGLQQDLGMSVILITHDLAVVSQIAEQVLVMYLGKGVEYADTTQLFDNPMHPYTRGLWRSIPTLDGEMTRLTSITGTVPTPIDLPPGCSFFSRCEERIPGVCDKQDPPKCEVGPGHWVCCCKYMDKPKTETSV